MACLALAACNGTDGGGGGGGGGGGPDWATRGVNFDSSVAQQIAASPEFQFVDASFLTLAQQSSPYLLHNVHLPLSAGLSGAGQIVAILDNGFRTSHQEFDGKTIYQFGNLPNLDHGTHVAALVGGVRDGIGMHGVAPGVALHLSSYDPDQTGPTFDATHVTAAVNNAANLGAVALNNSWGFSVPAQDLADYLNDNGGSVAAGLNEVLGYPTNQMQAFLNALNAFQINGVVVWAVSNNENMTGGDVMAALPAFESALDDAWIAAINGYFEVDGDGNVSYAERISAPCGYAARFCLAGDGTTYSAAAGSDSEYDAGTGTSFVAPQIAGAVALMAEAFPDLSPAEWTDRLLATADNSWFAAEGVSVDGVVDFGDGITHAYSTEWGHGIVDLEAAFSPIGSVAILTGETIADAGRVPLEAGMITSGAGFGDAIINALQGREITVFDTFNGDFRMDAGVLAVSGASPLGMSLTRAVASPTAFGVVPQLAAVTLADGGALSLAADAGGVALAGNPDLGGASMRSLASNAAIFSTERQFGNLGVSIYGFAGAEAAGASAMMGGVGANVALETAFTTLSVGVGQSLERGALLGLVGNDAFDFGSGSSVSSANFGFSTPLGPSLSVFGNLELGVANATGFDGSGLIASVSAIGYRGLQLGASLDNVITDGDRITVAYVQPMRIESGTAALALPVSRTADGAIITQTRIADLAPSGRQRDLTVAYDLQLSSASQLRLRMQFSIDAGHIAGSNALGFAIGYRRAF